MTDTDTPQPPASAVCEHCKSRIWQCEIGCWHHGSASGSVFCGRGGRTAEPEQASTAPERDKAAGSPVPAEVIASLAAKWDANASRNQCNGQKLLDDGDGYGSEGLAVAEALGACSAELTALLAVSWPAPAPAPDAAALTERAEKAEAERDGLDGLLRRYERITTAWTRGMYSARIDCQRGDVKAAAACLSEGLDGYDGTEWDGTETGAEWWERTKAEEEPASARPATETAATEAGAMPGAWIVITATVNGNPEGGYTTEYASDLQEFDGKSAAVGHGFQLGRSDDFNLGLVRKGQLESFWWMGKRFPDDAAKLAAIGREIGLSTE
jgi:hypothetical protein